ncbi:MAG: hypothetical protein AAFV31_19010 [Pseudomonadota bacterium]
MTKHFSAVLAALALQTLPLSALTVTSGNVIRGVYSFATFGATTVEPTSFLLRLSSADLFGDGDSVGIRYLAPDLTPLSFSQFDSTTPGLDPTVGILFKPSDMLVPVGTPAIPSAGFLEIVGLAGSFDVLSVHLTANEDVSGSNLIRRTNVSDFELVDTSVPPVPLPPAVYLLLLSLAGMFGLGRLVRRRGAGLQA